MTGLRRWSAYFVVAAGYFILAKVLLAVAILRPEPVPSDIHTWILNVHHWLSDWPWIPFLVFALILPSPSVGGTRLQSGNALWQRVRLWHYLILAAIAAPATSIWRPGTLEPLSTPLADVAHQIISSNPLRDLIQHQSMLLFTLAVAIVLSAIALSGPRRPEPYRVEVTVGVVAAGCSSMLLALALHYDGSWSWTVSSLLSLPTTFLALSTWHNWRSPISGFLPLLLLVGYVGLVVGQTQGYPVIQYLHVLLPWVAVASSAVVLAIVVRIVLGRKTNNIGTAAAAAGLTILDALDSAVRYVFLPVGMYSGAVVGLALMAGSAIQYLVDSQQLYLVQGLGGFALLAAAMVSCRSLLLSSPLAESTASYLLHLARLAWNLLPLCLLWWVVIFAGPSIGIAHFRPGILTRVATIALAAAVVYILLRGVLRQADIASSSSSSGSSGVSSSQHLENRRPSDPGSPLSALFLLIRAIGLSGEAGITSLRQDRRLESSLSSAARVSRPVARSDAFEKWSGILKIGKNRQDELTHLSAQPQADQFVDTKQEKLECCARTV